MKKVLITGGTKGIGLAITKKFVLQSYEVLVLARSFKSFPDDLKTKIRPIEFDLNNVNAIPDLVQQTGYVDVLVNNAGIMNSLDYDAYTEDARKNIIAVNLEAPVALITAYAKGMIEKGSGRIVSTASLVGEVGHYDVWYGITKAGIINFTKSFAKVLGKKGIIINCVAPGIVEGTGMYTDISDADKEKILKRVFINRFVKPEEVADTVYWLSTESPEYINGICIDINNGAFMR